MMGAVAAAMVSARAPVRAGIATLVAAVSLQLFAAPPANPVILGGVAVACALLTVLFGVGRRFRPPARP